jgi:hypothetical protein
MLIMFYRLLLLLIVAVVVVDKEGNKLLSPKQESQLEIEKRWLVGWLVDA